MPNTNTMHAAPFGDEERTPWHTGGMPALVITVALMTAATVFFIRGAIMLENEAAGMWDIALFVAVSVYLFGLGPLSFAGFKVLRPNEALVFTLLGKYHGSLRTPGFYFVNPIASAVKPAGGQEGGPASDKGGATTAAFKGSLSGKRASKAISLKTMTLCNDQQKINDALGNPIVIGIVVIWKVVNPTKAVFNVDDYPEFLSIQCDSALRNIVRLYPYDSSDEEEEKSLRGSSQEVAVRLKDEIQEKVGVAGMEILEARITQLSYAPEIAAAMLQRQQASAVIAARQKIVEGAVGMVEMALDKLSERDVVKLDEERKAAMVSNLLVVLCSNKDTQPVVNSGSIY